MRMYSKYAEANGFKTEIVEASESDHGGYKEISFQYLVVAYIIN